MASVFSIRERKHPSIGGPGNYNEVFYWTSEKVPGKGLGAFACPQNSIDLTLTQRTSRTDYPGSSAPTEQVIGSNYEPVIITGLFDDRYNSAGFAQNEMNRVSGVSRRGSICEFEIDEISLVGIITSVRFEYSGFWRIGYEITISVHGRDGGDVPIQNGAQPEPISASQTLDNATTAFRATADAMLQAPQAALDPAAVAATQSAVNELSEQIDTSAATFDYVEDDRLQPFEQLNTLVSRFDIATAKAINVIDRTLAYKADVELTAMTMANMLNFETWSRSLREKARVARDVSIFSSIELKRRTAPDARQVYRPYKGESFYSVSNKFYGTPYEWRSIADRNGIDYFELTGDEVLIIPDRGAL